MLGFELAPTHGEMIYSLLSRHCSIFGIEAKPQLCKRMFGRTDLRNSILFPHPLDNILANFSGNRVTSEQLINDHTPINYYKTFIRQDRINIIKEKLKDNSVTPALSSLLGVEQTYASDRLRYCRSCCSEDKNICGMASWKWIHQMLGVLICPYHHERLLLSSVFTTGNNAFYTCPDDDLNSRKVNIRFSFRRFKQISDLTLFFVLNPRSLSLHMQLRVGLLHLLDQAGYLPFSVHTRRKLICDFIAHFGENLLAAFGFNTRKDENWLTDMLGAHVHVHHPAKYIFLLQFLGFRPCDLGEFPAHLEEDHPSQTRFKSFPSDITNSMPGPKLMFNYRNSIIDEIRDKSSVWDIQERDKTRFDAVVRFDFEWLDRIFELRSDWRTWKHKELGVPYPPSIDMKRLGL